MTFLRVAFLRTAFNYDADAVSDETALRCPEPTRTQQSFRDECDINVLIDRFGIGYTMPAGVVAPTYGDFTFTGDFNAAMQAVTEARESFMTLEASVRERFGNNPARFVEFCSNDDNRAEAEKLGLVFKRPVDVVPSASDPAPVPVST